MESSTVEDEKSSILLRNLSSDGLSYSNGPHITEQNNLSEPHGMDDVLEKIGCGFFQVLAYMLAAASFFAFPCRNVITLSFINVGVTQQWNLTSVDWAMLPGASAVGVLVGGITLGMLSDRYGRVWPYLMVTILLACSVIASALSPSFYVFLVFRTIVSFFINGLQDIVYSTLLEFLPVKNRGQIGILVFFNQSLGSCVAALLAWLLIPRFENGWRYFVAATSVPCILVVVYRLAFFCESPRYLAAKGRKKAVWKVFKWMAKLNGKQLEDIVTYDDFEIGVAGNKKPFQISNVLHIIKPPMLWHSLGLLIIITIVRRFIYAGTFLFFAVLLNNLSVNPYFGMVISSISQIPGIFLMSIITNWPWFGRLNTFRLFSLIAATSFFLFAFVQNQISIPIFTVFIFFSIAPMMSMVFTYAAETYPTEIRTTATGLLNIGTSIGGLGIAFISSFLAGFSKQYPWLFPVTVGSSCIVTFFISFTFKQDMHGKKLQDTVK